MPKKPHQRIPAVLHAVPVFFAERPYWLFLTHKKSAPIAQHLPLLGADCAEWDPSSKSWRITHDRVGDALDAVSKVAADIKICDDCHSGEPDDCQAWDPIDGIEDYELRDPEEIEYESEENPTPPTEFWEKLAKEFFDRSEPIAKQFVARAEAAFAAWLATNRTDGRMSTGEAAEVLGLQWPCSKEQIVTAYRRVAVKAHPDHGGSDTEMAKVNAAREALERAAAQ